MCLPVTSQIVHAAACAATSVAEVLPQHAIAISKVFVTEMHKYL
eukprot:CAMPEP_0175648716 /NCGR_PEP_ID=MMETSP0097-20121207/8470_1 /TAXON_ID=311494 /ORGANISM="Alexandrium monilatum, Strain CCMP3105" /LENGTH=43 /DNA_ID= /DNA_START= /DNA_END= /DNA_ORIENTATION=